jgi:hypothetical protein
MRFDQNYNYDMRVVTKWCAPLVILLLIAFCFVPPFSNYFAMTYSERNSLSSQDAIMGESAMIIGIYILVSSISKAWLISLVVDSHRQLSGILWLKILLWIWVAYETISGLLTGSRITLALPLMLFCLVYLATYKKSSKRMMIALPLLAVAAIIIMPFVVIVGELRIRGGINDVMSPKSLIREVVHSGGNSLESITSAVVLKFNSIHYGAVLVEKDGIAKAGCRAYTGSALSLVPRTIIPDKPVPGSADGTWYGHYSRVAAIRMGGDGDIWNVGVSPVAVTIWQVGYLGLPVLIVANFLFLALCDNLLKTRSLMLNGVGYYLIALPTIVNLICPIDQFIMLFQRGVLFALCVCLIKWLVCPLLGEKPMRAPLPRRRIEPYVES